MIQVNSSMVQNLILGQASVLIDISGHYDSGVTTTSLILQALCMCMWVCGEEVMVGDRMGVSAVGGLQSDGSFWVRQVHNDPLVLWQQELALTHISNAL